jgi:pimeloyl-ACP methyl ester carboxylesterase
MPLAQANNISLHYEVMGSDNGVPLLLIMGLGSQGIRWPDSFCKMLVNKSLKVIRFDNRDVGLSQKLDNLGLPEMARVHETAPYTLSDMAKDAVGLLDGLGLTTASILGLSMGGMIAQIMAIEHPERVARLMSFQSTTGASHLPGPTPDALKALLDMPPSDKNGFLDHMGHAFKVFSGGSAFFDEDLERRINAQCFDRGIFPSGTARQLAAVLCAPDRSAALANVQAPTLVLHGTHDTLIPPEHGEDTAQAIPGARLHLVEGMGHGMCYPALWEPIADVIAGHIHNPDSF